MNSTKPEVKCVNDDMQQRARECFKTHMNAFDEWIEGDITKIWEDEHGILCIKYSSGNWWHYNEKGEWW